jgi:hypothetical protein
MEQKPMSIYEFKRGDIITRIEPSEPIPGLEDEDIRDRTYIGSPLRFLGVANGCVYVERPESKSDGAEEMPDIGRFFKMMMGGASGPINLPLDLWKNGWSYYIDPYNIGKELDGKNKDTATFEIHVSKAELEKELKSALVEEDYNKADKIQKRLNKLK